MSRTTRAAIVAFALVCAGCSAEVSTEPIPGPRPGPVFATGTLQLDWSINGSKDPALCNQAGADALHVDVLAPNGAFLASYEQDCRAMATSITLNAGDYTANAWLIDFGGRARRTSMSRSARETLIAR